MASTSALLKSASSRKSAIQTEKNRLVDMEWSLSAKTVDDFNAYATHYNIIALSSKSSDRLTYQNKITSARKSYMSNEIQRSSIDVLEGRGTKEDKLNTMVSFYQQAVDIGDLDTAQNLNLQIDNLYQSIQTDRQASMNLATQAYNAGFTTAKEYISELKNGTVSPFADDPQLTMRNLNEELLKQGPERMAETIQAASVKYGIPMASFEDIALYMADNTIANAEAYRDSYPQGSAEYQKLDNEVYGLKNTNKYDLPGVSLTYDELKASAENVRAGLPSAISLQSTPDGFKYVANKVANWTVTTDENGNAALAPNYVMPNDAQLKPTSAQAAGGAGYTLVTQDIGGGQVNTYAVLPNGDMYNANGFNPAKPKGKVGNTKDFAEAALQQKTETPEQALQKLGYKADANNIYLPNDAGGEVAYKYNVDENGNIQYYTELHDKSTGDASIEMNTIDVQSGHVATASQDFIKYQSEQKRLQSIGGMAQSLPSQLQNQQAASQILQPAGASGLLQNAKNITTANTMKAAQIQQAASAAQISALPAQPLQVKAIPQQAQPLKVTASPVAHPLKVTALPAPSVSVYQAPVSQGTKTKVTVSNQPNTTKVAVR